MYNDKNEFRPKGYIQANLVISNSLISNYRLSRSENLVPVLTMTTGNKIMWKRGEFSSFSYYFIYIYIFLTSGVKLHIHLLNVVVQVIVFLTLSTLICRGTDISKCLSESLGIRDNETKDSTRVDCNMEADKGHFDLRLKT